MKQVSGIQSHYLSVFLGVRLSRGGGRGPPAAAFGVFRAAAVRRLLGVEVDLDGGGGVDEAAAAVDLVGRRRGGGRGLLRKCISLVAQRERLRETAP